VQLNRSDESERSLVLDYRVTRAGEPELTLAVTLVWIHERPQAWAIVPGLFT